MITAVQEISNLIEPVASAARAEASQLGHKVMWGWGAAAEVFSECGGLTQKERCETARAGSCWC